MDDVVRFQDIHSFVGDEGWWVDEYEKGRMWFPGAVKTCYATGPGWDFVHANPEDWVTRDVDNNLYVWRTSAFFDVYELVEDPVPDPEVDQNAYRVVADEFRGLGRWRVTDVGMDGLSQSELVSSGQIATIAIDVLRNAGYRIEKAT